MVGSGAMIEANGFSTREEPAASCMGLLWFCYWTTLLKFSGGKMALLMVGAVCTAVSGNLNTFSLWK